MAITTAVELASYIKWKHYKDYGYEISPLKMQKSLYFCFAYWGGFVRKGKENSNSSEINVDLFDEELFPEDIEAWVYGPVVRTVYNKMPFIEKSDKSPFEDDFVKRYIDGILKDTLSASDFALVEASHNDDCWKNNFNISEQSHNNIINKEDIIREYARK